MNHDHPTSATPDPAAAPEAAAPDDALGIPLNRAERRAKGKGKKASVQNVGPQKSDRLRDSQIMAQPKLKGKRGNR